MKKFMLLLVALLLAGAQMLQAQRTITGTVLSADDNQGIPGVSVMVKGTNTGTTTNINGQYSLTVPSAGTHLVFSFMGMTTQEIEIGGMTTIDVVMQSDAVGLQEFVVTGYGVARRAAFTGAATMVGQNELRRSAESNIINSLQGAVPGLKLNLTGGQPGAPTTAMIRGMGSVNASSAPLYVIDGVPIASGWWGMNSGADNGERATDPLSLLDPSQIESITVLKDATATSIYGARASNGVIVITTRRGAEGKPQFSFGAKYGVVTPVKPDRRYSTLNTTDFFKYYSDAIRFAEGLEDEQDIADEFDWWGIGNDRETNTNWFDEVTRNGNIGEYFLNISGGSDRFKYFLSGSAFHNQGILYGSDMQRYSGRANIDAKVNKRISYGVDFSSSTVITNGGVGGGFFDDPITLAMIKHPYETVKFSDGSWNPGDWTNWAPNPVALRSEYGNKMETRLLNTIFNPYLRVNIMDNLIFQSRVGLNYLQMKEFAFQSILGSDGADVNGRGQYGTTDRKNWIWTNTVNWMEQFGKHRLNILLGQEVQRTHDFTSFLSATDFPSPFIREISTASNPETASTTQTENMLNSYFSNVEYDWSDKYYLSASLRRDGSSKFLGDNIWGTFWSIGARWRITQEDFMKSTSNWLNNAAIRSSYGTAGNQAGIDNYASRTLYSYGSVYNGFPGYRPTQTGNSDLKWETSKKFNIGFDALLFDRVSLNMDYYNNVTEDLLFNMPISGTSGMTTKLTNIGSMRNSGVEVAADVLILNQKNLRWSVGANFTKNKNEIVKLSTDEPIIGGITIREVGRSWYSWYMEEWAGVNPDNGAPLWYLNETGNETTSNFADAAKRHVGSAEPKFYGGFSTRLEAYGFDLGLFFTYSMGAKIYGSNLVYDEAGTWFEQTTYHVFDNYWREPGQITNVPRPDLYGDDMASEWSSRFLMNGNYLKLRSMVLGYTIPKHITSRFHLTNARIYFNGDNLFTKKHKDFRGNDPEVDINGNTWWQYPIPRNFTFGITLNF